MAIDFDSFPEISSQDEYRMHEIAHICPAGMSAVPHHIEECLGYCVNLLVGVDREDRETGIYEVYVDSHRTPAEDCLHTRSRVAAEDFLVWLGVEAGNPRKIVESRRP